MGLSDLVFPTAEIDAQGIGKFSVRGLSLPDISTIMRLHGTALEAVYLENIIKSDDDPTAFSMSSIGKAVLQSAPEAVALAIALACDEEEMLATARKLPIPVQVDAVEQILRLTFHTEEDLGNLIGTVLRGSESVQRVMSHALPDATFEDGSAESAAA